MAITCLESETNVAESTSFARKAKSLVQRWLEKPADSITTVGDVLQPDDIVIERDTIVLLNVKLGRGSRVANI